MSRNKRTTLSDLLADDVRDYFLREGVSDQPPQPTPTSRGSQKSKRSSRRSSSKKKSAGTPRSDGSNFVPNSHTTPKARASWSVPSSSSSSASSSVGSLRAGWATTPSSTSSSASSPMGRMGQMKQFEHPVEKMETMNEESEESSGQRQMRQNQIQWQPQHYVFQPQQYHPQQQYSHHQESDHENYQEQQRGQRTSERRSFDDNNGIFRGQDRNNHHYSSANHGRTRSGDSNNNMGNIDGQTRLHRRHGSGSGSFQSRGSTSSRSMVRTAADAEFLRRYAEERERTNLRMAMARPNWELNSTADARIPLDVVDGISGGNDGMSSSGSKDIKKKGHGQMPFNTPSGTAQFGSNAVVNGSHPPQPLSTISRPYHAMANSSRPPTVTGSHRPGLASIDNDDWEEDDRLERRDKRKMERKEARKQERHRRKHSNMGDSSVGSRSLKSAESHHQNQYAPYFQNQQLSRDQQFYNQHLLHQQQQIHRQQYPYQHEQQSKIDDIEPSGNNDARWDWRKGGPAMTMNSQGSVSLSPGNGMESGSSTLCYSTSSSQPVNGSSQWDSPGGQVHVRDDSMGSFLRKMGSRDAKSFESRESKNESLGKFIRRSSTNVTTDSPGTFVRTSSVGEESSTGVGSLGQLKESQPYEPELIEGNGTHAGMEKPHHVRPLSYLSASSSDGGKSGERSREPLRLETQDEKYDNTDLESGYRYNDDSHSSPSIFGRQRSVNTSSTSGPISPHYSFHSSRDGSSSLLGSSIISSSSNRDSQNFRSSGQSPMFGAHQHLWRSNRTDEESSDGSYESDGSSESSYSTETYSDDESYSNTSTSREDEEYVTGKRANRGGYNGLRDSNTKLSWEPVNFDKDRKKKVFFQARESQREMPNERDGLLKKSGSNYSSTENMRTKFQNKNNRTKQNISKRRLGGPGSVPLRLDDAIEVIWEKLSPGLLNLELLISNMPSLVGSLALAWVSVGVDWFKWYEETFSACQPVAYHSKLCVYPEFPGCFACDTTGLGYKVFLNFHYLCSVVSFLLASFLIGKIIIAFPVVRDELANPTTAAPLGLLCMALEKCLAGNFGAFGKGVTYISSALQTCVAVWFIFISVVYRTLPEPSWFPNTTGIGLAAAKMYLYWTLGGYFLGGFSILSFVMFYFVALYRIHKSDKISAPVCWVQLSGPAVVLYGFTIFGQPGSDEEDIAMANPDFKEHFFEMHRKYYMPIMDFFFACCMISMASALYCVKTRWKPFRDKEFSPAHVGFCAPLVSHANALQAYRNSLNKYSLSPPETPFKTWLYFYWTLCLILGTFLVLVMTWKFFLFLPKWCKIDVEDDEIPPEPEETLVTQLLQQGEARDAMTQNFVSAAVLQANESGGLVRVLRDGRMKYVRSRRMPSMGFDTMMNISELMSERDRLLQRVSYAAPVRDRGGMNSFDDAIEAARLRPPPRRRRMSFLSFDASTMMRGEHR